MARRARSVALTVMAVAVGAATVGCQPPPKPPPKPVVPPPPPMSAVQQRSSDTARYRTALGQYDADVGMLPGHSDAEHRAAAAAALSALGDALRLAYGRPTSPAFDTDVSVVDAAAQTTAEPDVDPTRLAAVENQAAHAAVSALRGVADHVLYSDAELPPLLDAAQSAADAGRTTIGPLHQSDATDAFLALGTALHRVDDDLQAQFADVTEPTPTPVTPMRTPMDAPPATMPATMPMAAPGTMMPATSMPAATTP